MGVYRFKNSASGIYKILNTVTGDFYIGSSKDVRFRWMRHQWHLNRGDHHNPHLQNAWSKYGSDVFTFEVLVEVMPEQLVEMEQEYLDQCLPAYNASKSADRPTGTLGLHWKMPEEAKKKISAAHKGKPKSEEHKENIRKALIRVCASEEIRTKRKQPKSEEHKRKIGDAHRGRKQTPEAIANRLASLKRNQEAAAS